MGAHAGGGQLWFPLLSMAPAGAGLLHPGPRATGPGILLELVFLPRGKRPSGQNPKLGEGSGPGEQTVATKAAPSAGLEARGARTGAC